MIKESFQKGKTGLRTPKPTGGKKKSQEKQNLVYTDPEHTGSGHGPSAKGNATGERRGRKWILKKIEKCQTKTH